MLKDALLFLARQEGIRRFVSSNPAARRVARRFVAGEVLDEAMQVVQTLNTRHISVSLDHLGENVSDAAEAKAAANDYVTMLDRIAAAQAEANISVKLTALGLDVAEDLCRDNLRLVLRRAADMGVFVRVDMEGSAYTQRTLDFVLQLRCEFDNVGTVIQSMLRRSPKDVETLIANKTRVRLVKGAYLEPPAIAYPKKSDVDAAYVTLLHELLQHGVYPAIATHDEQIVAEAQRFAQERGIGRARF